ncbi:MAG: hypothetical protein R3A78_03300 [Polyangiales bacterium]|nr:hypothetical protein [Myxococcales bacterium]
MTVQKWFGLALVGAAAVACGAKQDAAPLLAELRSHMTSPVDSMERSQENSRVVERVVEEAALSGKSRAEVASVIGKGDVCSRHPRCAELEFDSDDWYYEVGEQTSTNAPLPLLIVGFDHSGRVARVWNLRTHE